MEVATGGDAYSYIATNNENMESKCSMFERQGENSLRFLLAGVILGLQYLRNQGIIYRDLKP